jgi:hypothetical protein
LNQKLGTSQPDVEEASAKEMDRPLASSGQVPTTSEGLPTTIAWYVGFSSYLTVAIASAPDRA